MSATLLHELLVTLTDQGFDAARSRYADALDGRIGEVLRLAEASLRRDPQTLLVHLLGRLDGRGHPAEAELLAAARERLRPGTWYPLTPTLAQPFPSRLHTLRHAHGRQVNSLLGLVDNRFVSAGEDGRLLVGRVTDDGLELRELSGHAGPVNALALSPDRRWLATAGDDCTVRIWSTATLACVHVLRGHEHYVRDVSLSDDRVASISEDRWLRVWSLAEGRLIFAIEAHTENGSAVALSPDGKLAATSSLRCDLRLWDIDAGEQLEPLYDLEAHVVKFGGSMYMAFPMRESEVGHRDAATALAFVDRDTLVSGAAELIVWDLGRRAELRRFESAWPIRSFELERASRRLLMVTQDPAIYSLDQGTLLHMQRGPDHRATAACWLMDEQAGERLLVGGDQGTLELSRVDLQPPEQIGHVGNVHEQLLSRDGRVALTGDSNGVTCVWELETGRRIARLEHLDSGSRPATLLADGRVLTTRQRSPTLRLWSPRGELLRSFDIPGERVPWPHALLPLDDRRVVVGCLGEGLYELDLDQLDEPERGFVRFGGLTKQISRIAATPDHDVIVTVGYFAGGPEGEEGESHEQLQAWSLARRELLWTRTAQQPEGKRFSISFGDPLVFGDWLVTAHDEHDDWLCGWQPRTGERGLELALEGWCSEKIAHAGRLWLLIKDPQPEDAWSVEPGQYRIATLQPRGELEYGVRLPWAVHRSLLAPAQGLGVIAFDDTVIVFDLADARERDRIELGEPVYSLAMTPDGRRLIVGTADGRVHVLAPA